VVSIDDTMRAEIKRQLVAPKPKSSKGKCQSRGNAWSKPYASDALGVSPDQIPEAREYLRRNGVTADFNEEGQCLITSSKQFQDVARASGMKDGRDGYEVRNDEGIKILTGRRPVQEREAFKRQLRRLIERGE